MPGKTGAILAGQHGAGSGCFKFVGRARAHAAAASLACQHPLFGESSFLEQNRVTAATVQRCTVTLNEFLAFAKMTLDELKLLPKLDEMVVEMLEHLYFQGYGHAAGGYLMTAVKFAKWIQSFSDLPRAMRALTGFRRSAPVGSPLGSSRRVESLENSRVRRKRFVGRTSFGRSRQSTDEIHSWQNGSDTSLELVSSKVRRGFCQMGRDFGSERDHHSSLLGSSRRSVVR